MKTILYAITLIILSSYTLLSQSDTTIKRGTTIKRQPQSKWIVEESNHKDTIRGAATLVTDTISAGYTITKDTILQNTTVAIEDTIDVNMREKAINIGVRGGVNLASMRFKGYVTPIGSILDAEYQQDANNTGFVFGIFAEFKTGGAVNWMSLQPELLYVRRGFDGDYKNNNSLVYHCEETIDYFEGRLGFLLKPLAFASKVGEYFHLSVSPYIDFSPRGSVFAQSYVASSDDDALHQHGLTERLKVGDKGHITNFDIGVGLGVGFKVPIPSKWLDFYICGDFSYDLGLLDNHPIREIETGNPARYNRGMLFTLGLSVPIYQPRIKETNLHTYRTATYYDRVQPMTSIRQVDVVREYGLKVTQTDTLVDTVQITQYSTITKTVEVANEKVERYYVTDNLPEDPCSAQLILILATEFEHSKATLRPDMVKELDNIAQLLNTKYKGYNVEVYGHTDSSGSSKYPRQDNIGNTYNNLILSEERARSVADYLRSKLGMDRIDAEKGYGYSFSLVKNVGGKLMTKDNRGETVPYSLCLDCVPADDPKRGVIQKDRRTEIYIKCVKGGAGVYDRE